MNANGAVDVPGPAVGLKPISDCPKLPSSRGDASIELWHVAVNPTVFLEKGGLAIAGLHSSGGEENGALRGGELQLQA